MSELNKLLQSKLDNGGFPVDHGRNGWFGLAFVIVVILLLFSVVCLLPYFGFLYVIQVPPFGPTAVWIGTVTP